LNIPDHVILVLAGGNALGAYQGGVLEALQEHGIEPRWVVGASIGAINGAIIAGNAPVHRLDRLRDFWRLAEQFGKADPSRQRPGRTSSRFRRTLAANQTMVTGRPGLFVPRLFGIWPLPGLSEEVSLFETAPLLATLRQCVDFDRLNSGVVRFTATAVDVESGEDVAFDTAQLRVEPGHLRASAAFPVVYPPVEIDGRVFVDPAVSANMPLGPILGHFGEGDTLCLAIDLIAPGGERPLNLPDAVKRAHDLVFASQARHAVEALRTGWRLRLAERKLAAKAAAEETAGKEEGSFTLLQVAYSETGRESAAKMLDYSEASIQERWAAGYRDMRLGLEKLAALPDAGRPGFTALRLERGALIPYD
jgi:NTE family protein